MFPIRIGVFGAALFSASILFINPSYAEHNITVYGPAYSLTAPSVARAEEDMRHIPGGGSIVAAEEFQDKFTSNLRDALESTPGVYAQTRYGDEIRLSIRGSGVSRGFHLRGINVLVDGIPINLADGSGDLYEVDPISAQHIEIYRGGNALRYGAANLGGAINVVTPSGKTAGFDRLLRVDGGSFDTARTHMAATKKGDHWDLYAAATGSTVEGYRDHSQQLNGKLRSNIGFAVGNNAETRFYLTYNNINQDVPGTISRSDALNRPKTSPLLNRVNDYARDIRSVRFSNKTAWTIDPATNAEAGFYVNDKDLFHPINTVIDQESIDWGSFARIESKHDLAGLAHKFILGLNYSSGTIDALQYTNIGGSRGVLTASSEQEANNLVLYGESELRFRPDLALVLGIQALHAERDVKNRLTPAASDNKSYDELNPKIGLLYDLTPASQIFANISRSSEIPTFSELVQTSVVGFVPLDPQTAWTAEIGSRGASGNWKWDAALYRSWIDGEMLQFTTNPSIPAATFNADKTIHQGLEAGLGWVFARNSYRQGDSWTVSQIYNWNDFFFDGDEQYSNNQIAGIPEHVLRTELRYATDQWSIAPNMEFVPKAPYVDFANTLKATSYAVFNVESKYMIDDNKELFFEARNIFNKNYISNFSTITAATPLNTNVFYPGEPLSIYGGLKIKF